MTTASAVPADLATLIADAPQPTATRPPAETVVATSDVEELPQAGAALRVGGWAVVGAFVVVAGVGWTQAVGAPSTDALGSLTVSRWRSITFAVSLLGLALVLLQVLGSKGYGVLRPLIGADRRFSTSLTQLGLWTLAVPTVLAFLLGRVVFEGAELAVVLPDERWDEYLLLLGGPFASAVLAKAIVVHKVQAGVLQKTEPTTTSATQVLQGDDGGTDLADAQYLIFNVVALGYFVWQFVTSAVLPEMPAPLLALTGSTAAVYVANKAAQRNAPTITSVTPPSARQGDVVTIYGTNFDPAGSAAPGDRLISVALTGVTEPLYGVEDDDTMIRVVVPADAPMGHQTVQVVSSAGVETTPHALQILSRDPFVLGVEGGALTPGASATLTGRHLGRAGEAVRVVVDGIPVAGAASTDGDRLTFPVPAIVVAGAAGTVTVRVERRTGETGEVTVPVTDDA